MCDIINKKEGRVRYENQTRRCFWADLTPAVGDEQGGISPVLVIQSDVLNVTDVENIGTIIVLLLTYKINGNDLLVDVPDMSELFDCKVLTYHLRAISPMRFREYRGHVSTEVMAQVEEKLKLVLGIK